MQIPSIESVEHAHSIWNSIKSNDYKDRINYVSELVAALRTVKAHYKPAKQPKVQLRRPVEDILTASVNLPFSKLNNVNVDITGIPVRVGLVFQIAEAKDHPLSSYARKFIEENNITYRTVRGPRNVSRFLVRGKHQF